MRISEKRILNAMKKSGGIISVIAQRLGCSRRTIYDRVEKSKKIKDALMQAKEELIDVAESKLANKIEEGDIGAIKFYLQTQAKQRGYVEKQEIDYRGTQLNVSVDIKQAIEHLKSFGIEDENHQKKIS